MDRSKVVDLLNHLEQKYPVDAWDVNGVLVWPVVKFSLFAAWRDNIETTPAEPKETVKKTTGLLTGIKAITRSFYHLNKLLLQKKTHIPILFVSANVHRVGLDGQFVNRYFEPIAEMLKRDFCKKSMIIEYQPKDMTRIYSSPGQTVFLDKYYSAAKVILKFKSKKHSENLPGVTDLFREFDEKLPGLLNFKAFQKSLLKRVDMILVYQYIFNAFFKKYTPQYAMCLCYYTTACYGLTTAARKGNVKSIDMQHGGQGRLHPAYSGFNKVPLSGYNTLPDIFWCWDAASANSIQAWIKNQLHHRIVVGGNPWLSYFFSINKIKGDFPDKKIILYTLQLNEPESFIIEAICNSPANYQWWLRLHPRGLNLKAQTTALLDAAGVRNAVEIDKATSYPLPYVLQHTALHISNFSGSVIEAAQLGVKSILISPIGVVNYAEYIENGDAFPFLSDSADDLLTLIGEMALKRNKPGMITDLKPVIEGLLNSKHGVN